MKRLLSILLALILAAGCALAEDLEFSPISDAAEEAVFEADAPLFENASKKEAEVVEPTLISIKKSATKTVYLGTTYLYKVTGKTVAKYGTGSKKIAAVDQSGLITLKKAGKVGITAKLKSGKRIILTLKIVDPTIPTGVSIAEGKKGEVLLGDALALTAVVAPATADQAVKWTSSDKSVATVSKEGVVTGLKWGAATITATTSNKKKATFALTVRRPLSQPYMISHAMGGIDEWDYSNSLEAFLENYSEGHRIFEVDFEYTSDGKMVLCHNWKRKMFSSHKVGTKPTYAQFMGSKIYEKYTPLDLDGLFQLMREFPDAIIITDTKYTDLTNIKRQFKTIVSRAKALGMEDALDRMVVEVYSHKMFKAIEEIHHFNDYIFTLYKIYSKAPSASQFKSEADFCRKNGIGMIAMKIEWWKASYKNTAAGYDLDIGLYTTNSEVDAKKLFNQGVTALWTDYLPPLAW